MALKLHFKIMSDASFSESLISAYLDGELSSEDSARVHRMIQQNPEYAQLLEEFQQQANALQQLPKFELDADFASRVMASPSFSPTAIVLPQKSVIQVGHERWIGAVSAIGALAAAILVILTLPLLNSPSSSPTVAKSARSGDMVKEGDVTEQGLVESDVSAATVDSPAVPTNSVAPMSKEKALASRPGSPMSGLSSGDLGADESEKQAGTFDEDMADDKRELGVGRGFGARSRAKQGETRRKAPELKDKRESSNSDLAQGAGGAGGLASSQMLLTEELMEDAESQEGGPEMLFEDHPSGLAGEASDLQAPQIKKRMQSVNVMQVDLPAAIADRERVLELLRKHDVVLPVVDKRANQNLAMVEAGDGAVEIYYILANKVQMTGFAMELSKSSPAVISMYQMNEIYQQNSDRQMQAAEGELSPKKTEAKQDPIVQLRTRGDSSIGVPMDSIVVKDGGTVYGSSTNVRRQLSSRWYLKPANELPLEGTPDGVDPSRAEAEKVGNTQLNAAEKGIGDESGVTGSQKKPVVPALAPTEQSRASERSLQLYLLILQRPKSADPAADPDKVP